MRPSAAPQPLAKLSLPDIEVVPPPKIDEVKRVTYIEPTTNTQNVDWIRALLVTYAGAQLLSSVVAFNMLLASEGGLYSEFFTCRALALGCVVAGTHCVYHVASLRRRQPFVANYTPAAPYVCIHQELSVVAPPHNSKLPATTLQVALKPSWACSSSQHSACPWPTTTPY